MFSKRTALVSLGLLLLFSAQAVGGRKFGGVSTDQGDTQYTRNHPQQSWMIYAKLNGSGGSGFGRMFMKQTSGGTADYNLNHDNSGAKYSFTRNWSTTNGTWNVTAPATGIWVVVIVVYDSGSTSNNPIVYFNGKSQTVGGCSPCPSGTVTDNSGQIRVGNKQGADGNWNGDLGHFAMWNRLLTPGEAFALGAQRRDPREPGLRNKLLLYNPMKGGRGPGIEKDLIYPKPMLLTGTVGVDEPKPGNFDSSLLRRRRRGKTPAAGGGSTIIQQRRRRG